MDRKHQEVVVVSADSFHEFLDHGYVPDADVVVEIPFDDGDGQVGPEYLSSFLRRIRFCSCTETVAESLKSRSNLHLSSTSQVLSDAFGAHRLRTQVRNEPNKIYVPRAGRM